MSTNKRIIYFHGFGSSPSTDKVTQLKEQFETVLAFPINVDPEISLPYLEQEIDSYLLENLNSDQESVFIGTSLGAWYAGRLAKVFGAKAVLVNPAYSLDALKVDLPISDEIKAKYNNLGFEYPEDAKFFIATNDEVIDFSSFAPSNTTYNENADHRFNGEPFEDVIRYVKDL